MTPQQVLTEYRLAEARREIPEGTAVRATFATILEAGCVAFHKAYFGDKAWSEARTARQVQHQAGEEAAFLTESLISDISRMRAPLRETQTTGDFPFVLAQIRNRVIRDSFNPIASIFWGLGEPRTATDFRIMKGYRVNAMPMLPVRPEGTDVTRTSLGQTEDGYQVANYELAVDYTWEAWVNNDLSVFTNALKNLGQAASRTRGFVALQAIAQGIAAVTPPLTGVGGPSIDRLSEAVQMLAEQVDASGNPLPFNVTDMAYPAKWRTMANSTLRSENVIGPTNIKTPGANPVFGIATPHLDPVMVQVLNGDWLVWDQGTPFLECATLQGFEAGPMTYTKLPDEKEHPEQGSFDNHSLSVKVGDAVGAKATQTVSVKRIAGQ